MLGAEAQRSIRWQIEVKREEEILSPVWRKKGKETFKDLRDQFTLPGRD